MKINSSDYRLVQFSRWASPCLRWLGNRETRMLHAELKPVHIERPVFITGLARAGTTVLLETLAKLPGFISHRYRDFPFLAIPYYWNQILDRMSLQQEPVERAHHDRIQITGESPEAFEEPLWQSFFPTAHAKSGNHILDESTHQPRFEPFFRDHIRKLLLIRSGQRYLSKGNYNVTRIAYLAKLFPDARFIVATRHPLTQIQSLVRQHELFCAYAAEDHRVPSYLSAAGHYEFGPQRQPIRVDASTADRCLDAWSSGNQHLGYALQWADIYGYVDRLRNSQLDLADKIHIVRYEDFCLEPVQATQAILRHIDADIDASVVMSGLAKIAKSQLQPPPEITRATAAAEALGSVATAFAYDVSRWDV